MKIIFKKEAYSDLQYWSKNNKAYYKKIISLLKDIESTPYNGIGKPEALKHQLSGLWSRRISKEHRLIYKVSDNIITIFSCRYHYS